MKNKNALLRYEAIDECLSTHKRDGSSIQDLVNACKERYQEKLGITDASVSVRQVLYDLDHMVEIYGVSFHKEPDPKDHRKVLFFYDDGGRDIKGRRMSGEDYGELNVALWLLRSIVGFDFVDKAAKKIEDKLKVMSDGQGPIFAVESNSMLKNFDDLTHYFNDIRSKTPIKVSYRAHYTKPVDEFWIQPYYLKQYNNRWFLFCWRYNDYKDEQGSPRHSGDSGYLTNLAVDRIEGRKYNKNSFGVYHSLHKNTTDFDTYFDDIIGVSKFKDSKLEHIVLKVNDEYDWYRLITKPIHKSQFPNAHSIPPEDPVKVIYDNELTKYSPGKEIAIDVMPNNELYTTLRQFEHIEVVSPADVRKEHLSRVRKILGNYKRKK